MTDNNHKSVASYAFESTAVEMSVSEANSEKTGFLGNVDDPVVKYLIDLSREMLKKSYCPYSHFAVGAALLSEDGQVFSGCNIENASYGLSMCAERTALFKAVSEGCHKFKAIVISSHKRNDYTWPCGACRQVLAEFGTDWDVYVTKGDEFLKKTVDELLPHSFTGKDLNIL